MLYISIVVKLNKSFVEEQNQLSCIFGFQTAIRDICLSLVCLCLSIFLSVSVCLSAPLSLYLLVACLFVIFKAQ